MSISSAASPSTKLRVAARRAALHTAIRDGRPTEAARAAARLRLEEVRLDGHTLLDVRNARRELGRAIVRARLRRRGVAARALSTAETVISVPARVAGTRLPTKTPTPVRGGEDTPDVVPGSPAPTRSPGSGTGGTGTGTGGGTGAGTGTATGAPPSPTPTPSLAPDAARFNILVVDAFTGLPLPDVCLIVGSGECGPKIGRAHV